MGYPGYRVTDYGVTKGPAAVNKKGGHKATQWAAHYRRRTAIKLCGRLLEFFRSYSLSSNSGFAYLASCRPPRSPRRRRWPPRCRSNGPYCRRGRCPTDQAGGSAQVAVPWPLVPSRSLSVSTAVKTPLDSAVVFVLFRPFTPPLFPYFVL